MGQVLAASGLSLNAGEKGVAMTQQTDTGLPGYHGAKFCDNPDGGGLPRDIGFGPARQPRNQWTHVPLDGTKFWCAYLPAGTSTNWVAPYHDASLNNWRGWPGGTIIILAGEDRHSAEPVAHFHEDSIPGYPVVYPQVCLPAATFGPALAAGGPYRHGVDFNATCIGYNGGAYRQVWEIEPCVNAEEEEEEEEEEEIERRWPCEACAEESPGPCYLYLLTPGVPTYLPHSSCINDHSVTGPFYYKYARCEVCASTRARNARDRARDALEDIDHVQLAIDSVGCGCYDPFGENTRTYTGDCFSGVDGDEDAFVP